MTTLPTPVQKRILWIDAVKGGCILLVLLAHTYTEKIGENPFLSEIFRHLYYFMACYMPVFFVVSGYTFKDSPDILQKKFKQLVIPYAQWALIYFFAFIIVSIFKGEIFPLHWLRKLAGCLYSRCDIFAENAGFANPLMPPGAGPLWFLTALFASYILYIPIHRSSGCIKTVLISLYSLLALAVHHCPVLLPWSFDTALVGALFICSGQWMKASGIFSIGFTKTLFTSIAVLTLYIWVVNYNGSSGAMYCRHFGKAGWHAPILFTIMGISGSYLWCVCCQLLEKLHLATLLSQIGRHSLALLCSHMLVYIALKLIFSKAISYQPDLMIIAPYIFIIQISCTILCIAAWTRIKKKRLV